MAVESNEDVAAELGAAMAMVGIELGLQRSAEAEAELLAELGITLIINGILNYFFLNLTCYEELQSENYCLQSHMCLFRNSSDTPRTGAVSAKMGWKMGQKLAYGITKRGQKSLPPK